MDDGLPVVPGILLFLVLLGLNALFVAAEFAYVTVRPTQMRRLAAEGNPRARIILRALDNLDFYVSATQLGITMATVAIGYLGEPVIAALIEPPIESIVGQFAPAISHVTAIAAAFILVTGVHIVVGEFMPKTVALQSPDKATLWLAIPMEVFVRLFRPLIWLLNSSSFGILRIFGGSVRPVAEEPLQGEDLAMMLEGSASAGLISRRELNLTRNTLRLSTLSSETLMVPRNEVVAVPASATTDDVRRIFAQHRYTRYPVIEDSLDNIVGIVDVKNTVFELARDRDWRAHLTPPVLLPVSISVEQALEAAREEQATLVVLIDEYGGTAGILSVFDIMQYLAGGLPDDQRPDDSRVHERSDGSYVVPGSLNVMELEAELGVTPAGIESHTVGGMVMERLGRLPETGDAVDFQGYRFVVTSMDERRVEWIHLFRAENDPSGTEVSDE